MTKLLVILGSTSTGKTDLGILLAKKFNGELMACDSRQVYRGLDIGTGKLPSSKFKAQSHACRQAGSKLKKHLGFWVINGIKVWMYDVVDPSRQYSVFDYVRDANKVIDEILARGKLPIIVGGTGLYLKALLEGLSYISVPVDLKLRKELEGLSLDKLQKRLREVSPQRWEKMNNSDRQNPRRLVRAIELATLSLRGVKRRSNLDLRKIATLPLIARNDILKIGLTAPREVLYQRIDERVIDRISQGMIDEARKLHKNGLSLKRMRQLGLEYGVLADFLQGRIKTEDELIKIMQGKIHGFARRQMTWFKKEKGVCWFDMSEKNYSIKIVNRVAKWYD